MRPSSLLGSRTEREALLIDLSISSIAEAHDLKNGTGDWWWLSVLKALTGAGADEPAGKPQQEVRWL